uniref:Uncharacterized protein n=1 Tax=Arundo donax TaxID=35708 RepID=A0A0A9DD44_ARUDO
MGKGSFASSIQLQCLCPSKKQHLGHKCILISRVLFGEVSLTAKRSTLYLGMYGSEQEVLQRM